jgi:hypothetical protein
MDATRNENEDSEDTQSEGPDPIDIRCDLQIIEQPPGAQRNERNTKDQGLTRGHAFGSLNRNRQVMLGPENKGSPSGRV